MPLALGIDIGTTNTKVALVDVGTPEPRVRAVAAAPTDLRAGLHQLIARALDGSPPPEAVGIASMAETGVPLGADGEPLGPWMRWDDQTAAAEAEVLARRLGRDNLIAATGVRPSAKVPLARWAWLRTHRPGTWAAMASWAGVADYAGYLLTGTLTTDHTLAGRTMAYRLPGPADDPAGTFDHDLLAEVGLRPGQLPRVGFIGRVNDAGYGLRIGTPVVIAGHDHAVGAYGCGVREPGDVADSVGTAEAVMTVVAGHPDPVPIGRAGMSTVVTVGGRYRAVLAGSSSAGATVAWWREHEAAVDFDRVEAGGPTGMVVLPYLSGRQTPAPDPRARLRVAGRRVEDRLAQAVLEGLSLQTRWMLAEQSRLAGGVDNPAVRLLGGPVAVNPAWVRIKARVLPGGLRVVHEAEPVAAGAAIVAAVRAGCVAAPGPAFAAQVMAGGGTEYDEMFGRFVAAATASEGEDT